MNKDRIEDAQQKAKWLLEWFAEQKDIPETGVKLNAWSTIVHTPRYIEIHTWRLNECKVLSSCWRVGYMALYNLKKLIENDYQF